VTFFKSHPPPGKRDIGLSSDFHTRTSRFSLIPHLGVMLSVGFELPPFRCSTTCTLPPFFFLTGRLRDDARALIRHFLDRTPAVLVFYGPGALPFSFPG